MRGRAVTTMRGILTLGLAAAALLAAHGSAVAQATIKIATIVELSGPGTAAGSKFHDGVALAIKEINAAGGILGKPIENHVQDTQSDPDRAKARVQQAVDDGAFAVLGPVFSGSIMASMGETRRAEMPHFVGGEAAAITQQGNPYVFRTSFTQATAMPKIARYISLQAKLKSLAVIYVNNDFGRGGMDMLRKSLEGTDTAVVAEISTESAQTDFSAAVAKAVQSKADAVFVYTNEEESARVLRELRKQRWTRPIIGETTLTGQRVIELAGGAANGALAHVGLSVDAPVPAIRSFRARYEREYKATPDHNSMKGYAGVHVLKAAIERTGRLDRKSVAQTMKGLKINTDRHPGALMYTEYDHKGDVDRMSFLVEVKEGKQQVVDFMPPLAMYEPLRINAVPAPAAARPAPRASAAVAAGKP